LADFGHLPRNEKREVLKGVYERMDKKG